MAYKVVSPIEHNLKRFNIGDSISFERGEDAECDELLRLGVIRPFETDEDASSADPDDLAVLGVKALLELAKAEGVEVPAKAAKADLVAAIEAKRIADAGVTAVQAPTGAADAKD